jgi:hypothetical protein
MLKDCIKMFTVLMLGLLLFFAISYLILMFIITFPFISAILFFSMILYGIYLLIVGN